LIERGIGSLSNVELLAVILGTGRKGENVLDLSQRILTEFGSWGALNDSSLEELLSVDGIGLAKATKVLASVELGKRLAILAPAKRTVVTAPSDVAGLLMMRMRDLDREYFKALILNIKNEVLKIVDISVGSLNSSIVHPRELYKSAIKVSGARLIIAHNHPSGDPTPSEDDIRLTKRLVEAGDILGIELLDHIIFGDGRFCSLKEEGLF
jgi:DNA repair protein RadC